jgi:hypothetical protein
VQQGAGTSHSPTEVHAFRQEEWENTMLNAINNATGEFMMSRCGKKSGVNRDGQQWTEAWGSDDIYGKWGTRHSMATDGSEVTEHWGSNMEGDKWCAKWGLKKAAPRPAVAP